MNDYKIIFAGPVGSGKTTAIDTLSDEAPHQPERLRYDPDAQV